MMLDTYDTNTAVIKHTNTYVNNTTDYSSIYYYMSTDAATT